MPTLYPTLVERMVYMRPLMEPDLAFHLGPHPGAQMTWFVLSHDFGVSVFPNLQFAAWLLTTILFCTTPESSTSHAHLMAHIPKLQRGHLTNDESGRGPNFYSLIGLNYCYLWEGWGILKNNGLKLGMCHMRNWHRQQLFHQRTLTQVWKLKIMQGQADSTEGGKFC